MRSMIKYLISLTGIVCFTISGTLAVERPTHKKTVFVQLFEWRWDDIAKECENVLGPAGYAAVQISPPNEHSDHLAKQFHGEHPWWLRYQPVSYQLHSRSGNPTQFAAMVKRCNAVGVKIYADTIINHMATTGDRGVAGTAFNRKKKQYAQFQKNDFHTDCIISQQDYQWSNDAQLRQQRANNTRLCQLADLPDLNTGDAKVRTKIQRYLHTLQDLGVGGIRIDAAKHMHPEDIQAILNGLDDELFIFQEVIDSGKQPVSVNEYLTIANVTEFNYSQGIGEIFSTGKLTELATLNEQGGLLPSEKAVVFIDNHDNQRGHGMAAKLNHRSGKTYDLASIFMLAWPYGYPKVMSSYEWGGKNDNLGPPHDQAGNTLPVYNSDGSVNCFGNQWVCEHRRPAMANMVAFRNALVSASAQQVTHWWDNGNNQIAFALSTSKNAVQSSGFVVSIASNKQCRPHCKQGCLRESTVILFNRKFLTQTVANKKLALTIKVY
ncbi:MAG: hypothetical protein JKY66_02660 [Spongiibacteraceae bacterium]|nr:hypothetical protein [Spongiibacteraceae bacterium]